MSHVKKSQSINLCPDEESFSMLMHCNDADGTSNVARKISCVFFMSVIDNNQVIAKSIKFRIQMTLWRCNNSSGTQCELSPDIPLLRNLVRTVDCTWSIWSYTEFGYESICYIGLQTFIFSYRSGPVSRACLSTTDKSSSRFDAFCTRSD